MEKATPAETGNAGVGGRGLFRLRIGAAMTGDRRDGIDRRDDSKGDTSITLGEVYRLCERIEERMTALSDGIDKDVHTLRGNINAHGIALATIDLRLEALEDKGRDWRGWIASGLIGGLLAMVPYLVEALKGSR